VLFQVTSEVGRKFSPLISMTKDGEPAGAD
jgi:hypothetical protein